MEFEEMERGAIHLTEIKACLEFKAKLVENQIEVTGQSVGNGEYLNCNFQVYQIRSHSDG